MWIDISYNKPTLTIEWASETTQSTIKQFEKLISLQGGQTTNTIKIKSNKEIYIRELILFGWGRSEMIDFVITLFFLFVFNVLNDNLLDRQQQQFKLAECDRYDGGRNA